MMCLMLGAKLNINRNYGPSIWNAKKPTKGKFILWNRKQLLGIFAVGLNGVHCCRRRCRRVHKIWMVDRACLVAFLSIFLPLASFSFGIVLALLYRNGAVVGWGVWWLWLQQEQIPHLKLLCVVHKPFEWLQKIWVQFWCKFILSGSQHMNSVCNILQDKCFCWFQMKFYIKHRQEIHLRPFSYIIPPAMMSVPPSPSDVVSFNMHFVGSLLFGTR